MTRQFGGRFEVVAERLLDYQPRPETTEINNIDDTSAKQRATRMWANAQPDVRPAEHRWRPLFNAAKFG